MNTRTPRSDHGDPGKSGAADGRQPTPPLTKDQELEASRARPEGADLTTDHGIRIAQTDDSLKAGPRGPTLLEDFHLREKLTRFDHERIPERVVHARGAGAHGFFQVYASLADLTRADFLGHPDRKTSVFVRFSTVVGSRGSADTARDVRGFAVKFYTEEGNFDLVGNNMPVFFIQDGMKFPDLVHAVKPEPRDEIPQAASAHDTFWDFVSLTPETTHMLFWVMSDRAIPRSYRMMEGFGVHTFRLVNAGGGTQLVKFHWKPVLGLHSLVWDEASLLAGRDPDFHRRDLRDAIDGGHPAQWELGLQVVAEEDAQRFGFDLLDPTKLLPEELVPVRRVGLMTLDRNPDNYFAEVEQVAFHVGNLVPGIDVTNDPLLQARLFSYLDTQLTRLGGPNFAQLPINRPLVPARNHQQDGFGQHVVPTAAALYHPNTVGGGLPRLGDPATAFVHHPDAVRGVKTRDRSASFADHFGQARLFLASQSRAERRHLAEAFAFELSKVERPEIRRRVVENLSRVDADFAGEIARAVGVDAPAAEASKAVRAPGIEPSPALSIPRDPRASIATRRVAILCADGVHAKTVDVVGAALRREGAWPEVIAIELGEVASDEGPLEVARALRTAASVQFDAVFLPGGARSVAALVADPRAVRFVEEAYRHAKTIGYAPEAQALVAAALRGAPDVTGVVTSADDEALATAFVDALRLHRHFEREGGEHAY